MTEPTKREEWLADMVLAFCNGEEGQDGCAMEWCPLASCPFADGRYLNREDVLRVAGLKAAQEDKA